MNFAYILVPEFRSRWISMCFYVNFFVVFVTFGLSFTTLQCTIIAFNADVFSPKCPSAIATLTRNPDSQQHKILAVCTVNYTFCDNKTCEFSDHGRLDLLGRGGVHLRFDVEMNSVVQAGTYRLEQVCGNRSYYEDVILPYYRKPTLPTIGIHKNTLQSLILECISSSQTRPIELASNLTYSWKVNCTTSTSNYNNCSWTSSENFVTFTYLKHIETVIVQCEVTEHSRDILKFHSNIGTREFQLSGYDEEIMQYPGNIGLKIVAGLLDITAFTAFIIMMILLVKRYRKSGTEGTNGIREKRATRTTNDQTVAAMVVPHTGRQPYMDDSAP